MGEYGFYLGQPWWLTAAAVVGPLMWVGWRSLRAVGRVRRAAALGLRGLVVLLLVLMLARPTLTERNEQLTVIAVVDRSQSVPAELREASVGFLNEALTGQRAGDRLAVVDVAETASIAKLPSEVLAVPERSVALRGDQSKLAQGVQMAMAIAPPDSATRIVLVSDGNETEGDLREAARIAAANGIPVDVLALQYEHEREVVFERLAAPMKARSGQTVTLRFILNSTHAARGKLVLTMNGRTVNLDPSSAEVGEEVELKAGTNVKTVSLPLGVRGMHEFEAVFVPEGEAMDSLGQNNRASAMTVVAGPGQVLVADSGDGEGEVVAAALAEAGMAAERISAWEFPENLTGLLNTDAVVLVNTENSHFSFAQQEMMCRYVRDLGGGLVMAGGPESFGAGGWIGSPGAEILPVDLDPPQKKQMPKGALVLVIDRSGSMTGEKVKMCKVAAAAAARALSSKDYVGVVAFDADYRWVVELQEAQDKEAIGRDILTIGAGGGTVMAPALEAALEALAGVEAAVKHVVVLTDGQTAGDDPRGVTGRMAAAGITVSVVGVGEDVAGELLVEMAKVGKGKFYYVRDPRKLPQIFVKEAQVVRRALIREESFVPQVVYGLSEIVQGLGGLPPLDGMVLTGAKGGLNQVVVANEQGDPVLATCQAGLGRCAAFTSSADSRWAAAWQSWSGQEAFWEQAVRWAARSEEDNDCEVYADVQGRSVTVTAEAVDAAGRFVEFGDMAGQVIGPEMGTVDLELRQVGAGVYRGNFEATGEGSYIVNLRYRKAGEEGQPVHTAQGAVTVPYAAEFRDLRDNTPLLMEASALANGRVVKATAAQANLFDRAGVKFPETALPLTKPLMLVWVAVFWLDVAVRRIAVDVRAMGRRMAAAVRPRPREAQRAVMLERLRVRRRQVSERFASEAQKQVAARRYEAVGGTEAELPVAKLGSEPGKGASDTVETVAKKAEPAAKEESHLERLLRAKRKGRGT